MIAFSNESLRLFEDADSHIMCPRCHQPHELEAAGSLSFYRCGGKSYLGAVDGKLIIGEKSDLRE